MNPILSAASLRAGGLSTARLRRLVQTGELARLRRGWYATSDVDPAMRRAVGAGGRLTCVSALERHGVWTMPHDELHLRVASGTAVRPASGLRLHWTHDRVDLSRSLDDVESALVLAVECLDLRAAVVAVDSALNRRLTRLERLETIFAASARGRRVLAVCDGRSESGLETLARLALRRLRIRVRSQFVIPSAGRVDLLIGDRLVLELDGRQWHGDFESDRARDRQLATLGFLVIRASYRQVMEDWPTVERQVVTLVRRDEHRWRTTLPQGRR